MGNSAQKNDDVRDHIDRAESPQERKPPLREPMQMYIESVHRQQDLRDRALSFPILRPILRSIPDLNDLNERALPMLQESDPSLQERLGLPLLREKKRLQREIFRMQKEIFSMQKELSKFRRKAEERRQREKKRLQREEEREKRWWKEWNRHQCRLKKADKRRQREKKRLQREKRRHQRGMGSRYIKANNGTPSPTDASTSSMQNNMVFQPLSSGTITFLPRSNQSPASVNAANAAAVNSVVETTLPKSPKLQDDHRSTDETSNTFRANRESAVAKDTDPVGNFANSLPTVGAENMNICNQPCTPQVGYNANNAAEQSTCNAMENNTGCRLDDFVNRKPVQPKDDSSTDCTKGMNSSSTTTSAAKHASFNEFQKIAMPNYVRCDDAGSGNSTRCFFFGKAQTFRKSMAQSIDAFSDEPEYEGV